MRFPSCLFNRGLSVPVPGTSLPRCIKHGFAAATVAWSLVAQAQSLPARPLMLVVPYPPGGVSDVLARGLAPALGQALSRTVVVENVTGASGSIAAAKFLASPADGSQLLVGSPTETVLAPLTIRSLKYSAGDFRMLGVVYRAPLALYARPGLEANSVDELARLAARGTGKSLSYGSPGNGSIYHIVTEKLRTTLAIDAVHVPYRGGGPMLQDLMAGTIDFTLLPQDNVLRAMVDSGKLRMLGVTAEYRDTHHPNVPTFDESARARGFGHPAVWVGLFVPQAMPEALAAQLHGALVQVLGQPATRQVLEATGGRVPAAMTLGRAQAFYEQEARSLQDMARSADVQPN